MWGAVTLAVVAGVSFVCQQAINANLRAELGYPFWAGFVSYIGGTLAMLVMIFVVREPLLTTAEVSRSSVLSWTGGVFGAAYIAISIILLPKLGAATLVALLVVGQMVASLVFDHYGFLGVPEHPLGVLRVAGAALLVLGVVLVRL